MRIKKTAISLLLIFAILASCFIILPAEKVEANSEVIGKGASFYTSGIKDSKERLMATGNLSAWFNIWKDGNRYPYRGGSTGDWSPYGSAQCYAYADNLLRAMVGENLVSGKNYKETKPGVPFNKVNFLKYCKDLPAGSHIRIGLGWHSISLLKVSEETINGKKGIYVYWTDCNWDHRNTIYYYRDTLDGFVSQYNRGYNIAFIRSPLTYHSLSPVAHYYTLKYDANGGKGSIKSKKLQYGVPFTFAKNTFTRAGYTFQGWQLYRSSDKSWYCTNGYTEKWIKDGSSEWGYTRRTFSDQEKIFAEGSYVQGDTVTAFATWSMITSKVWTRLSGSNRYETMEKIVNTSFKTTGGTVVVASGQDFKDALSATSLAGLTKSPVLLTNKAYLTPTTEGILKKLKPKTVYIAGGTGAVSKNVYNSIKSVTGVTPKRLSGSDAPGTSAALALAGKGMWKDNIAIIATNRTYKDALSAAPVAYAKGYPILLAKGGEELTTPVLDALSALNIKKVIIVGGTGAVHPRVERQLESIGISLLTRLSGSNAILTSEEIAKWGVKNGMTLNKMGVATSKNFPDALAGAALCGYNKSVLVLADDTHLGIMPYLKANSSSIKSGYIFGGSSAVGDVTYMALISATA